MLGKWAQELGRIGWRGWPADQKRIGHKEESPGGADMTQGWYGGGVGGLGTACAHNSCVRKLSGAASGWKMM